MNDDERYLFDLQGYLVIPDALDAGQLEALNAILDERIEAGMPADADTHRFGDLLHWGRPYLDLLDNPRLMPYVEAINGEHCRLDHLYLDVIRRDRSPIGASLHHGGTPYDWSFPYHVQEGRIYTGLTVVAYNLRDVGEGDGGFACIPGSHKANFRLPDGWQDLHDPRPCVQKVTGPAGSAVIFTEALTHGPLPWTGDHERRTVFYKYNNTATAFSAGGDRGEGLELTGRQRALLMPPCSGHVKGRLLEGG